MEKINTYVHRLILLMIVFNPRKYWRGPVWINMNWMLFRGLRSNGYTDLAERIKIDSLELIQQYGFYEYFDCRRDTGDKNQTGYGGNNFSWSAAYILIW